MDTNTATSKSKEFLNAVNDLFLTQHVNFPTHSSGTMPDLVFSTESNFMLSTESAGTLDSSDHDMIIVHTQLNCQGKRFTKTTRNWQKANIDAMKKKI